MGFCGLQGSLPASAHLRLDAVSGWEPADVGISRDAITAEFWEAKVFHIADIGPVPLVCGAVEVEKLQFQVEAVLVCQLALHSKYKEGVPGTLPSAHCTPRAHPYPTPRGPYLALDLLIVAFLLP